MLRSLFMASIVTEEESRVQAELSKTRASLDTMHKACATESNNRHKNARQHHNRKPHIQTPNFEIEDYVLVADVLPTGNKLKAT